MTESFWVKLTYKEFIGHYCEMTDAEIVADVRKSIGSFSNDRADGDDFGAKMVRKANARMNGEAAGASRANGQKGGRPKNITAAATHREAVGESTTGCKNTDGGSAENMGQRTSEALPSPTPIKTDPKPTRKAKAEVKPEEQKYPHGEFENIMLTTREYTQLCERLDNADSLIEEADGYFEAQPDKKRKYKSHYAMLLNWDRRRKEFEAPAKVQRFKTIDDINQERIAKAKREVYEMFHKGEPKAV